MDELRKGFHQQLDDARAELLRLATLMISLIPRATNVLLSGNLDEARSVIDFDDEIDAISVELEERCYQMLALQAPVAGDLRQVVSVVKMIAEIERSADLATNICKASRRIHGHVINPKLSSLISRMGEQAQQLWVSALESFEQSDVAKASAIDDMDSYLDSLQREFVQAILESHSQNLIDLQVAIQLAIVARFYERIGDHAVNIGDRVQYLVTGWLPEHKGSARFLERQNPQS